MGSSSGQSAVIGAAQLTASFAKLPPATAAPAPNPHRRPSFHRLPAGSFIGGFRTPDLLPGSIARARPASETLPVPATAAPAPNPHRRPSFHRLPAGSFIGGFRTPDLLPGSIARARPASETLPVSRPTSRLCRAGTAMLRAQGTFVAARRIIELRTKRSSAPNRGQVGGWLTPADRAGPSRLSGRRCRSPR